MSATGTLRHWSEDARDTQDRDDLAGLSNVGSASFDLTDAEAAIYYLGDEDEDPYGLAFKLAERRGAARLLGRGLGGPGKGTTKFLCAGSHGRVT